MKKQFLRFFSLFLALVLLTACEKSQPADSNMETTTKEGSTTDTDTNTTAGTAYNFSIYDDNGRKYTEDELKIQKAFDDFIYDLFVDSITSNYINLIFTVDDPEKWVLQ